MLITRSDEHGHFVFSPQVPPVAEIEPGETLSFETRDASNNQIRPGSSAPIDRGKVLPVTGPVAVRGAQPGDALAVDIERIRFVEYGHAWLRPGLGLRPLEFQEPYRARAFRIGAGIELIPGRQVPLRPMMGIIGVAPPEPVLTRFPGRHGGNLDCVDVTTGNTLWLPVLIAGAHLSTGDAHAAMGEGEVSGTGIETECTVTLRVRLHKGLALDGPVVTTPDKTVFLASAETLETAVAMALERAVGALQEKAGLGEEDAYMAASIAGNMRICQLVNGLVTVGHELPLALLRWDSR
jgi:amidase